ncbi:hypothetical protein SAMN04515647_0139 [Cohaesibacter sp. ES.047]|uniref:DUF1513 domain-containing protein n=1 Tax=Cohaesibacter sp. ES.047 TaxID=1798205 RepID=UPI000BB89F35|nr:DUF1513 domain-containing protein [Cohaesibacter sp. ES.047]SNY89998.1 hypothetical protein SAMN04515647_0139 [Cohaesibacter sp. ES.047]
MTDRRSFLAGMFAFGLCPSVTWADAGSPAFLAAARKPDGSYALSGLAGNGQVRFDIPLPGRGHAAAAHPERPQAVAFARRPGNFALVIDCAAGKTRQILEAPKGRHFYGHGAFSADGRHLFTSENDFESIKGVIGIWKVGDTYERIGEFSSGGLGPHDIKLMPDRTHLVIANGGIETHPDSDRAKLNISTMEPNLSYVSLDGEIVDQMSLPHDMHKNSIRHLSVGEDGVVAFAMQWQGDIHESPELLGLHSIGGKPRLMETGLAAHGRLQGYLGSVAYSAKKQLVAVTSPRGSVLYIYDASTGKHVSTIKEADVCGVAMYHDEIYLTSGTGIVSKSDVKREAWRQSHPCNWDNHLVTI